MSKLQDYSLEIIPGIKDGRSICDFKMKCPHCGETYVEDRFHGEGLTREVIDRLYTRYGSPVRKCKTCEREFLDRSMREAALEDHPIEGILTKNRRIGWGMLLIGVIVVGICLFAEFEIAGLLGLGGIAMIVMGLIRILASPQGLKTNKELKAEIELSKKRIADCEYLNVLKENGIIASEAE